MPLLQLFLTKCGLSTSLRSRRLEVVGERENGRARGRHARGVSFSHARFSCAHYFQAPATQAICQPDLKWSNFRIYSKRKHSKVFTSIIIENVNTQIFFDINTAIAPALDRSPQSFNLNSTKKFCSLPWNQQEVFPWWTCQSAVFPVHPSCTVPTFPDPPPESSYIEPEWAEVDLCQCHKLSVVTWLRLVAVCEAGP